MATQFKNRLVGVTILVASVVIFLPSIIDGKKTAYEDEFVATPIKPQLKAHTLADSQGTINSLSSDLKKQNVTDNKAQVEAENGQWEVAEIAPTATIDALEEEQNIQPKSPQAQALESAWTIQLGAFQNADNINLLLKKLHKAGFQAHTVPTEVIDGELTRVFVGPDVSKIKLEKQLSHLKRLTQLQGKIIPFNAVDP
ncbi:SPOR domain-containing protein [Psychromonas antarctica]|uniref:SPOR domain-containing protein n=1 Tax=Psychromonas antarctica TaxID=67573 RepID=UPI001EE79458|nr:SPOR domain-containing protein [Psychromonas antarctica]